MKRIASAMTTAIFVVALGLSGVAFHDGPHVGPDGEVSTSARGKRQVSVIQIAGESGDHMPAAAGGI